MIDRNCVQAWAVVHATRPAGFLIALVAVLSPVFATTIVSEIGFVTLLQPLWMSTLLTLIAGSGAAMASVLTYTPALPDPPVAQAARLGWAIAWLALAIAAANAAQLVGGAADMLAVCRNVLIYAALGLTMRTVAQGRYIWLPPVAITLAAALFGYPEYGDQYYWWAVMLDAQATGLQLLAAASLYAVALATVVAPRRLRVRPPNATRTLGRQQQ